MVCPNCKEQIQDQLLICPMCKESISEPVAFRKRSVLINKEAIQIYDELTQEEKKELDYMKIYKKEMYQQARNINLKNEPKEDVLDIFGKEDKIKPCIVLEIVLTIITGALIVLLFANHSYGFSIPLGISVTYIIYASIACSLLVVLVAFVKLIKKRKIKILVLLIVLHLVFSSGIIYLHFIADLL